MNNLDPTDFLVKVFANLDALKGEGGAIGSIFSTCTNKVTCCLTCNSWKGTSLNLGVLQVINFERLESNMGTDERAYFNSIQTAMTELSVSEKQQCAHLLGQRNQKKTLELLLADSYCIQPEETKWCPKCNRKTLYKNWSKLQSLSPGLIVQLSEGWDIAEVPDSINLRDCPAAHATYHLRAAVLQISNSTDSSPDRWICVEKPVNIEYKLSQTSPLLLFYERDVAVISKLNKKIVALVQRQQYRRVGLHYFAGKIESILTKKLVPLFQQLKDGILIANQEREIAAKSLAHQRSIAVDPRGKWECGGPTAAVEAALRGLSTIRPFTAFLETNPFTTEQLRCTKTRRKFTYFRTVDVPIPAAISEVGYFTQRLAPMYTGTEATELEYR